MDVVEVEELEEDESSVTLTSLSEQDLKDFYEGTLDQDEVGKESQPKVEGEGAKEGGNEELEGGGGEEEGEGESGVEIPKEEGKSEGEGKDGKKKSSGEVVKTSKGKEKSGSDGGKGGVASRFPVGKYRLSRSR